MSTPWNWPGSRWWRVDLHTHSPASSDFKSQADRDAKDWSAWVQSACVGLDAIALTDHNTPAGIDAVKAAAGRAALRVFPGVELTVGGIHLLCILDTTCGGVDVASLLGELGIRPQDFASPDALSTRSIVEAIDVVTRAGGLVIAAHVNGPRGVIPDLSGQERGKALSERGMVAVELSPLPHPTAKGWLDPKSDDVLRWLDGSQAQVGRRISTVECSDGHRIADLGRRFTWIKMTRPALEGLRLALLDGDGSLKPATHGDNSDPNQHAANVIERIIVRDARYMGNGKELEVGFNPWLNAIIGGRGTGKSTLVDFCRVVLRREGDLGSDPEGGLRAAFDQRMRVPVGRGGEGLLTETTAIELTYRKDGEQFVLSWRRDGVGDDRCPPIQRIDPVNGQRTREQGYIRERFPVRIYSQKQLFDLALNPDALLDVIDDSQTVRGSELDRAIKEADSRYLALCAEARSLRAQALELPARRATLADVKRKLEVLAQGGHAATLKEYRDRNRQDGTWTSIDKGVDEGVASVERAANALVVSDLDADGAGHQEAAFEALRAAHTETRTAIDALREEVTTAIGRLRVTLAGVRGGAKLAEWRAALAKTESDYQLVAAQLKEAGIASPDEYRDLLQRAATLEQEIIALEARSATAAEREREAQAALERRRALCGTLTERRGEFATSASNARIRISVALSTANERRRDFEQFVGQSLGITEFEKDRQQFALRVVGDREDMQSGILARLDQLVAVLRAFQGPTPPPLQPKDRRFEAALRKVQPEGIDRLALYVPLDRVEVSFSDPERQGKWQNLAQGSPGEQTAALLAFVLGYGDEPIILDQPEDDLDSTLIYNLLVQRLREIKPKRQVIVVTHNPNIVVHGDAELVVSLHVPSGQSQIAREGGLQEGEIRDEICRVMEGGREAFDRRYDRISTRGARRHGR